MEKSDTPQGQDNTSNHANNAQNGGTLANPPLGVASNPPPPTEHADTDPNENQPPTWFRRNLEVLKFVGEILILVVTIRIAYIYSGQLGQMIESNRIGRESLTTVQRAFMTCRDVTYTRNILRDKSGAHGFWDFTMPCENTGATQANVTAQAFILDFIPREPTEEQFTHTYAVQTGLDPPKAVRNVGFVEKTDVDFVGQELTTVTMQSLTKAVNAKQTPFFWGWISYLDVFPETNLHITEFCEMVAAVKVNPTTRAFQLGYTKCAHHNCADEYCDDYKQIVALAVKK